MLLLVMLYSLVLLQVESLLPSSLISRPPDVLPLILQSPMALNTGGGGDRGFEPDIELLAIVIPEYVAVTLRRYSAHVGGKDSVKSLVFVTDALG